VAAGTVVTVTVKADTGYALTAGSLKYNGTAITAVSGVYTFTMPAAGVTITGEFSLIPGTATYTVGIDPNIAHGTITADPLTAVAAGTTVTVTVSPDAGYALTAGTLKYNDGTDHPITGNTFTMPAANVTVTGTFSLIPGTATYTVGIDPNIAHGTIAANPNTGVAEGTPVIVTVSPENGYQLTAGTLKYNDGTDHLITGNTFTMPAANVTISGEFSLIDPNSLYATISFTSLANHTEDLTKDHENYISKSADTALTITVGGTGYTYEWYFDGQLHDTITGASYTLYGSDILCTVGIHRVTVVVAAGDVPQSTQEVQFRVVQ
jgi:hypothetical protein